MLGRVADTRGDAKLDGMFDFEEAEGGTPSGQPAGCRRYDDGATKNRMPARRTNY